MCIHVNTCTCIIICCYVLCILWRMFPLIKFLLTSLLYSSHLFFLYVPLILSSLSFYMYLLCHYFFLPHCYLYPSFSLSHSYVLSVVDKLVVDDYVIVYLHSGAPRNSMPGIQWFHRFYRMIDRRYTIWLDDCYNTITNNDWYSKYMKCLIMSDTKSSV